MKITSMALLALAGALFVPAKSSSQPVLPDLTAEIQEARRVLATAQMKQAIAYVDGSDSETVQEWLSLCNAYGPSGNEIGRSQLIYKLFRIYGLENVHIDDQYNVIGIRHGTGGGPTVVLNAHHDNVPLWPKGQPVEAFVADGRIWCPAANDDLMGIVQILTVLRAMNAAKIQTKGDVWFVGLTGEEAGNFSPSQQGTVLASSQGPSRGMEQFVRENYPHNLDWKKGDVIAQLHGGGGEGVSAGSTPVRHRTILRVFSPFEKDRWKRNALDALGRIIVRVSDEVRDPRVLGSGSGEAAGGGDVLLLNMSMVGASEIINTGASAAWIRFDMRSATEARLMKANADIQRIAREVTEKAGEDLDFVYEIVSKNGTEGGIKGFDEVNNPAARMAAAASQALYNTKPLIDPTNGCGDCVQAYVAGMPAMSFRGNVVDYGENGKFELKRGIPLNSAVRRRSVGHDVTESADINQAWSGIKHALLFAVAYTGLSN